MNASARITLLVAAAGATLAAAAAAHDLFVKMDSYRLPAGTAVQVPIINGTFQVSENAITPDRVADVSLVHRDRRSTLGMETWNADGDTTFFGLRTGEPGTYVLGVSTRPNRLGMDAADFNLYLASDGVVDVLKQRALDSELDEGAWEEYSKHVKGIFQVGDRVTGGLDVVLGYPAELVPLDNPYETRVGGELAFRALVDGKPVVGQLVIAGGDAGGGTVIAEREARTDADGEVRFRMERAGRWYVKFINMQKTDAEGLDYASKWATISFEIR
jgi:hypothetical protein